MKQSKTLKIMLLPAEFFSQTHEAISEKASSKLKFSDKKQ